MQDRRTTMTRNFRRLVPVAMLAAGIAAAAGCASCPEDEGRLKVLMVGNSFSISVLPHLPAVAKDCGKKLDVASLYIGGCSLERHWLNIETAATNAAFRPYRYDRKVDGASVADGAMRNIQEVLESKLSSLVNQDYTIIGGVDAVVDILNTVDRATEKHIMETLEIEEPELADEIRKKMFVFEDILLLDDKSIQRVLREVDNSELAIAMKAANEQVQEAIFNNLSKRLAVMIKEDMEYMGPVRMKDVEEAQQKIVNIIRKLEDSGEIIISRGGGDDIVV